MRIVVVGLNFAPEPTSTGRYTGELAEWLGRAGHSVKVVTAPPYYPAWKVFEGYRRWWYQSEVFSLPGTTLDVVRCPIYVPSRASAVRRVLHLLSFAASSAPVAMTARRWRPDVVFAVAPTLFALPAVWAGGRMAGCPLWLHVQDFEVGAARGAGILNDNPMLKIADRWERWCLRRCDRVSTISAPMIDSLQSKGVPETRRVFLPNWADTEHVFPVEGASSFRKELDFAAEQKVALYAGNMGEKQGLELLLDGARRMSAEADVVFVLAGDGAARRRLEAKSRGMQNVKWLPVQPSERLNDLLNLADVHLLPQRADVADLVMPSKLTNMLASARPVVATAAKGMAIHDVVAGHEAGLVAEPGDVDGFVAAIRRLMTDSEARDRMGRNGRAYAERYLTRNRILAQFEMDLHECVREYRSNRTVQRSDDTIHAAPPKK